LGPHVIYDYVREETKAWKNKDVNFWVSEEPKKMLEQNRVPPPSRIEESGIEVTV